MRGEMSGLPAAGVPGPRLADYLPALPDLDTMARQGMLCAGREVLECRRVLARVGLNVVGEVLRGQGEFIEMEHYPREDVYDDQTHAQYYYHAHRGAVEHGHFHTFLRTGGDAVSHLVAISMDAWGEPIGLFACNRWVTGETWRPAEDVGGMLDRFLIDHAWPSWPANRWIGAMLRLYRPWIEALLLHRDAVVAARLEALPDADALEDRTLEITGYLPISAPRLVAVLEKGEAARQHHEAVAL